MCNVNAFERVISGSYTVTLILLCCQLEMFLVSLNIFVKSLYFKIKSQYKETLLCLQDIGCEAKRSCLCPRESSVEKIMMIVAVI